VSRKENHMAKGKPNGSKPKASTAGAAFMGSDADAFVDAVVEFGVQTFQRKERERQYQEEVTYTKKREIAHQPKDPSGHTWTDGEFSQVYRHGESAATLAFARLSALRNLKERIDHVERLISNAIEEMPTPKSKHQVGTIAQLAGALAILRQQQPDYVSDVRIWSQSWLCAICNCTPCRERMEHLAKQEAFSHSDQTESPQCCNKHEDASLFLPF
jgi:hypothetical protein